MEKSIAPRWIIILSIISLAVLGIRGIFYSLLNVSYNGVFYLAGILVGFYITIYIPIRIMIKDIVFINKQRINKLG